MRLLLSVLGWFGVLLMAVLSFLRSEATKNPLRGTRPTKWFASLLWWRLACGLRHCLQCGY